MVRHPADDEPESLKRLVWFSIFMLPVIVLTVWLGVWQLERLDWKRGLISAIETRAAAPPVSLDHVLKDAREGRDVEYTRVTLQGRYDHAKEQYLFALHEGEPGWHVVTPLSTGDGTVVFVNRGFVPSKKQSPETRQAGQLQGELEVTGLVRQPQTQGLFVPDNQPSLKRWYWRDLQGMRRAVLPKGAETVAPFFVDAALSEVPGGWPKGGQTPLTLPNNHLAYAWTWFSMAAVLAGAYLVYVWTVLRGRKP